MLKNYGLLSGTYSYPRDDEYSEQSAQQKLREQLERSGECVNVTSETAPHVLAVCDEIMQDEWIVYSRYQNTNPYAHHFVIDGAKICNRQTRMVVLVHSLHTQVQHRDAIRRTWGGAVQRGQWPSATIDASIRVVYVFGMHNDSFQNEMIAREAAIFGDVIQGDFVESYQNMTLKSLLGLKWVLEYCPKIKYFVKSDDDMIINFPHLLHILKETNMTRSVLGPLNLWANVARQGKWGISKSLFPLSYYPPYESGSCYIISGDIIKDLYQASFDITRIFIDDVYITGMLGKVVGIRHINRKGFAFWETKPPSDCDIKMNLIVTGTRMTPISLKQMWLNLHKNIKCP